MREELDDNVCGSVDGDVTPEAVASFFATAGWSVRKSSWTEYQVRHAFAEIEFFRHDNVTGFHGVVEPDQVRALAGTFADLGLACSIELYEPGGRTLVCELRVEGRTEAPPE